MHIKYTSLTEIFNMKVAGFSDTLPLLKSLFPKRESYSKSSLASDMLTEKFDAHNASEDVSLLRQMYHQRT